MRGKQRTGRDREILLAFFATEPEGTIGAAGLIGVQTATVRANGLTLSLGPTDLAEGRFGFQVSHAEHLSEAQGLCIFAEEEVLRHIKYATFLAY